MKPGTAPRRDQQEFEGRLEAHRGIVFKLANAYCPAGEERDDLVQEICLQLWRSYPGYDRERRFSTWMFRVALNTAISFARAARTRDLRSVALEGAAADLVAAPPADENDARLATLHRFLHRQGELDRALVLLYLEDRSYREIAEILGISETNVGTRLNRCKEKMRQQLAPDPRRPNMELDEMKGLWQQTDRRLQAMEPALRLQERLARAGSARPRALEDSASRSWCSGTRWRSAPSRPCSPAPI